MHTATKEKPKLTSYPTNWPMDNRSRIIDRDDVMIITHPARLPHKYDPASKKWSPL